MHHNPACAPVVPMYDWMVRTLVVVGPFSVCPVNNNAKQTAFRVKVPYQITDFHHISLFHIYNITSESMKVNASNVREMSRLAFVICIACVVADMPHRPATNGAVAAR